MLKKLLKYDLYFQVKRDLPVYVITLAVAFVLHFLIFLNRHIQGIEAILGFLIFAFVILLIAVFLWTFIVSIKYFYDTMLKDEGYLRNTLPVSRSHIFLSQEISAVCCLALATIVFLLALAIAFFPIDIDGFVSTMEMVSGMTGGQFGVYIALFTALMFLDYIANITLFFAAMMLGQTRQSNKIMYSIAFGVLLYIFMQIGSIVGVFMNTIIANDYLTALTLSNSVQDLAQPLSNISPYIIRTVVMEFIVSSIYIIIFHCLAVHVAKTKLNLE